MSQHLQDTAHERWAELAPSFLDVHRGRLNIALHLAATSLGIYAFLGALAWLSPLTALTAAALWCGSLYPRVPGQVWRRLSIAFFVVTVLALSLPSTPIGAILIVGIAYAMQEVAHRITKEPSFQSSYMESEDWAWQLAEQTWYLPALLVHSAGQHEWRSMFSAHDRVLHTHLGEKHDADIRALRDWVENQNPSQEHTTHWWRLDLPELELAAFDRISAASEIRRAFADAYGDEFDVAPVEGMNEVYVAGPDQNLTSDTVFHMSHVDGPLAVYPFAAVYRCMVALSPNERVATKFPMTRADYEKGRSFVLSTGDVAGFDFHRELHYIETNPEAAATGQRITLKLHYVVYPKYLPKYGETYGELSTRYNRVARNVFLDTLTPNSLKEKLGAMYVVATTKTFETIGRFAGNTNAAYVLALALLSLVSGSVLPVLLGASFIHYLIYLSTFWQRTGIAYGVFVRDAVFFKAVSMSLLALLYIYYFEWNIASLALIGAGFGISALAAQKLGWVRTYFGFELGQVRGGDRIETFPYNVIPHPMILGAIVGLIGVGCLTPLREAFPWLIPAHVALYVLHALQEATDHRPPAPFVYEDVET